MKNANHPNNIIGIDFETYYSREFSLSKMPTQKYVLSPHFETIGVAVKLNDEDTRWFTGAHEEIKKFLDQFPWDDAIAVAHNAMFDGAILEWLYDIHPARYFCTMMAARPICAPYTPQGRVNLKYVAEYLRLGAKGTEVLNAIGKRRKDFTPEEMAKYAEYCRNDTALSVGIYKKLSPQLPEKEQKLIDATIRKFTQPQFKLNRQVLSTRLAIVKQAKSNAMAMAGVSDRSELMSNDKFAEILQRRGVVPPTKTSERTGKTTWAFAKNDIKFKELLDHSDPVVSMLVAARMKVKSTGEETRLERFIDLTFPLDEHDQCFAIPLLYYGAHTGRFSGMDKLNLQNLGRGSELRRALEAPEGYKVVAGDLSQIEARITATLAGQTDLVEQFASGADPYSIFATKVYGYKVSKAPETKSERFVGKTCFVSSTPVLTRRGWVPIVDVSTDDELWDGEEWVSHAGVHIAGVKEVTTNHGISATSDHEILVGNSWVEWREVQASDTLFRSALNSASLPSYDTSNTRPGQDEAGDGDLLSVASVVLSTWETLLRSVKDGQLSAKNVRSCLSRLNAIGNTKMLCQMMTTAPGCSTGSAPLSNDAITQTLEHTKTMESVVSAYAKNGERTGPSFLRMCKHLMGGIIQNLKLIALTLTVDTSQETLGLSAEPTISGTSEGSQTLSGKMPVYDIYSAGPRHRFTVLSANGPLIAHNCILGLQYGVGHKKLYLTLKAAGIDVTEDQCYRFVDIYRVTYSNIKRLWKLADKAIAAMQAGHTVHFTDEIYTKKEAIALPNGMQLVYPNLRRTDEGWAYDSRGQETRLYGAKLIENLVQALARIVVSEAELYLYDRGYHAALQVHDELVYVVHEQLAEKFAQVLEKVLNRDVEWMPELPVASEVAIGDNYYEAK